MSHTGFTNRSIRRGTALVGPLKRAILTCLVLGGLSVEGMGATATWTFATGRTGWGQTVGDIPGFPNNWSTSPDLPGPTDDLVFFNDGTTQVGNAEEIWLGGTGYATASGTGRFANSLTFGGQAPKNFWAWGTNSGLTSTRLLNVTQGIVMEADSGPVSFGNTGSDRAPAGVRVQVGPDTFIRNDSPSVLRFGTEGTPITVSGLSAGLMTDSSTKILSLSGTGSGGAEFNVPIANGAATDAQLGLDIDMPNARVLFNVRNPYSGPTLVSAGTLALAVGDAINSSLLRVDTAAVLDVTALAGGYAAPSRLTVAGGGTVAGSLSIGDGARLSPGTAIGTLLTTETLSWADGGNYNWQIADAVGTAGGSGWDLAVANGVLDITATPFSPFAINLWSLSSITPEVDGPATNFSAAQNYSWRIASAAGGITGFAADKFVINTSPTAGAGGFVNDLAGGTFSLQQVGNDLNLVFTSASGPTDIVINVPFGTTQTQAQAGYPTLSGGTPVLKTGDGTLVLDAANTLSSAVTVQAGTVVAADVQAFGTAVPSVAPGATIEISPVVGAANPVQLAGLGSIDGTIDVGTGRFALPPAGQSPGPDLRNLLIAGRSGGSWDGTSGILSSDAPNYDGKSGFAVGYRVAGDNSATVAWASLGDADLDGAVTTADVNAILTSGLLNTGIPGAVWQQGDFDYDGLVTTADINALLTTGRLNSGSYLPPPTGSLSAVPEPTAGLLAALGLFVSCSVRRRLRNGFRKLALVVFLGTMAAGPAVAASFLEVARIDLAPTSNPNNLSFIGTFPSSVGWNGTQLFVGGFNASGVAQEIGIVEVLDPLGTAAFGSSFSRITVPNLHAYNGLAASTTGLAAAYDDYAGTHPQRLQAFELDTSLRWELGSRSIGFRPMGGVAFDPGFEGAGSGVSSLQFGSGRRQLWDATTGDNIYDATNGMVIFGPGGSAWRGHDYSSNGDLWLRNQNRVDASTRTGGNSVTDNRRVVDLPAEAFVSGQNIAFMGGTPYGDLLIFNSRTETAGGQPFAGRVMVTTADGTMVNPDYTWLDGPPADGNGYYDFAYHAPTQTLALLDFDNRAVHLLAVTAPGPADIVIDVPFGTTQTQAQAGYPALTGDAPVRKTGDGTLVLDAANTLSSAVTVQAGTVVAADVQAFGTAVPSVAPGATIEISPMVGAANPVQLAGLGSIDGTIDVGTGRFTLPASTESPGEELRSLLVTGRSGGSWDGTSGILSSDAPNYDGKSGFAVGYRVAGDNSATVAWASLGDADLDGAVTTADVNAILTSGLLNTGIPGAVWQQGDFDYDGLVTTADINALLTTGRLNSGSYLPPPPTGSLSAVPEPSTRWLLAGAGLLVLATGRQSLTRKVASAPGAFDCRQFPYESPEKVDTTIPVL